MSKQTQIVEALKARRQMIYFFAGQFAWVLLLALLVTITLRQWTAGFYAQLGYMPSTPEFIAGMLPQIFGITIGAWLAVLVCYLIGRVLVGAAVGVRRSASSTAAERLLNTEAITVHD